MTAFEVTEEFIAACGFRMFTIPEIARTMQMEQHPTSGGLYHVTGNKREQMAQLGNAVTPPVTALLAHRLAEVLGGGFTFSDLFCGAGGSSIGPEMAGLGVLVLGLNHWPRAIETHAHNFPNADHDCADVAALTTAQIRRYPDSDVLFASPECTNHSLAKGARRRAPQAASLFDDGPAGDDEQDRSRATMWDVVRFAEQKIIKGKPYKAIVVENVVDAYRWGAGDDGGLFDAWRIALTNLGYESEIVWLNSMFAPPTPQSRDRMYVVYWLKAIRHPNLDIEPIAWCPACEKIVNGRQVWKQPSRPHHTAAGKPVGARYGVQYLYGCPDCHGIAIPGAHPAASAIDFTIPAPLIGDRERALAPNTMNRVWRGVIKLLNEPFAIRLTHGGVPKPLTLPLVTLTARHDMAMVTPVAGNTYETTPGNRARDAARTPLATVHGTLEQAIVVTAGGSWRRDGSLARDAHPTLTGSESSALVLAYSEDGLPRVAGQEPAQTQRTNPTLAMVYANRNNATGGDAHTDPARTLCSGGHIGIVMRNNTARGDGSQMSTGAHEPFRTLTGACHQSLIVPYGSDSYTPDRPSVTVTTLPRLALIVPPMGGVGLRDGQLEPGPTQTTTTRAGIVEVPV